MAAPRTDGGTKRRLRAIMMASSALAIAAGGAGGALAQDSGATVAGETRDFEIATQPLPGALLALAEQADLRLIAPQSLAGDRTAPALNGDYTASEALSRLLAGSGIAFEITPDRRLVLRRDAAPGGDDATLDKLPEDEDRGAEPPQGRENASLADDAGEEEEIPTLEEIVVTGSHIRGAEPVGSKLMILDQEDLRRTGFSSVQQVMQSLPQNFGGGPNPVTTGLQPGVNGANVNTSNGSSINLRGLGPNATLTVINGRRVALAGAGAFVDVSLIPLSAVKRIEVLADGASAIYGTDAVAGVTNIILNEDYQGVETRLRFGTVTDGGQREYKVSQLFGTAWDTGNVVVNYEYRDIDSLASADRDFAASNDLRPFGGGDFRGERSNPGNILAGGQSFAIPSGQDGTALEPADLVPGTRNLQNERAGTTLFPSQKRHSVFASARQTILPWMDVFVQGTFSRRKFLSRQEARTLTLTVPSTNPFFVDPVGGLSSVQVQYSFFDDFGPAKDEGRVRDYSVTTGTRLDLFGSWQGEIFGSFSKQSEAGRVSNIPNRPRLAEALADPDPSTAFNPFGDGSNTSAETLERIQGFAEIVDKSFQLWSVEGKADGPLFRLPAGDIRLAVGSHHREERLERKSIAFEFSPTPVLTDRPDQTRDVTAVFGELLIPLLGERNGVTGAERLEVSAAVRIEDYSDFGTTTNPKVGLAYSPVRGLTLRGTYGTAFRVPRLIDLNTEENANLFFPLPDPESPSGLSNVIIRQGNDPDLGPETARTWTAGVDFEPAVLPGLSISASYFDIDFSDRIARAADIFGILGQDDIFAPLIIRNPDPATAQPFLDDPELRNVVGSTEPSDVGAIVNFLLTNIGQTRVRGLDLTGRYETAIAIGHVALRVNASIMTDFKEAISATAPFFQRVDTLDRPVDWRLRGSLTWQHEGLSATAFINYVDNFTNDNTQPVEPISAQVTTDLTLAYKIEGSASSHWLDGLGVRLSVENLTDKDPPFVNNPRGFGFDPANGNPQGRFIALEVIKEW